MSRIINRERSEEEEHLDDGNEVDFPRATLAIQADTDQQQPAATGNNKPADGDTNANRVGSDEASGGENVNGRREYCQDPAEDFFALRAGAFDNAVEACHPTILPAIDGELRGAWLLTEIDHWDNEKERLVMVTDRTLIVIKFDFITLKILEYQRYPLQQFDKVLFGDLAYPQNSLVPKVDKLFGLVKGLIWSRIPQRMSSGPPANSASTALACSGLLSNRSGKGVRAFWNKGGAIHFTKSWNPWSKDIPWITLASHPLVTHKRADKAKFSIDNFADVFVQAVRMENELRTDGGNCDVQHTPVVIENYVGLASVFHNVNNLGFFKSRGKISF